MQVSRVPPRPENINRTMPRRSKSVSLKKTQEKEKQCESTSPQPSQNNPENDIPSEAAETEGAVEVIHWIPASTGSVIQIPSGSDHYNIQLHHDDRVVGVPAFQSDTVNNLASYSIGHIIYDFVIRQKI